MGTKAATFRRGLLEGGCAAVAGGGAAWYWSYVSREAPPPVDAALRRDRGLACKLEAVHRLTDDTSRFRFALPTPHHKLGLTVASHVLAVDASNVARAYTPVTGLEDRGHFDLVVKKYANGFISSQIHAMRPGDALEFRGPVPTLDYAANVVAQVAMVAGGTGITPMYQILRHALNDPKDKTHFRLLYASHSRDDVLLRDDLDALAQAHPDCLEVVYVVTKKTTLRRPTDGALVVGRIDETLVKKHLPPPTAPASTLVLVCGPDGLMRSLCGARMLPNGMPAPLGGILHKLGYHDRRVVRFE